MIKHTIYTNGDIYQSSFVEFAGKDASGNKVVIACSFFFENAANDYCNQLSEDIGVNVARIITSANND